MNARAARRHGGDAGAVVASGPPRYDRETVYEGPRRFQACHPWRVSVFLLWFARSTIL